MSAADPRGYGAGRDEGVAMDADEYEQIRQLLLIVVRHGPQAGDQLALDRGRRVGEQGTARRRDVDLDPPLVGGRRRPRYQTAFDEAPHDDGNRALVGRRAFGELIE